MIIETCLAILVALMCVVVIVFSIILLYAYPFKSVHKVLEKTKKKW